MTSTGFLHFWSQGDAITRSVAALLLLMSISAWVVILWKSWLLRRVHVDMQRALCEPRASLDDGRSTARAQPAPAGRRCSPRRRARRAQPTHAADAAPAALRASSAAPVRPGAVDRQHRSFIGLFGIWASTTRCSASRPRAITIERVWHVGESSS
jgi:hypothetical protein